MVEQLIAVGVLSRPHGVKGEIRLACYGDSAWIPLDNVFLQLGETPVKEVEIISSRIHKKSLLVCFKGFTDRTSVENLRGQTVLIPRNNLPNLEDGQFYLHDLLGFLVLLDETNEQIGKLEHVLFPNGQEVWSIFTFEGKEIFFPAVPEFVSDINFDAKIIKIRPPEGLLDLYQ